MFEDVKERIGAHIGPLLSEFELEIFEFSVERHNRLIALILLIDHEDGGVTVAECTVVNKALAKFIEEENLLPGDYTIEVSSPGLDRPLTSARDFRRVMGKQVKFHLKEKLENKLEHDGWIKEVFADNVLVELKDSTLSIPLALVQKAVPII